MTMYKLSLKTGNTYNRIKSFNNWTLDNNFLQCIFDDNTDVIVAKSEIISLIQYNTINYKSLNLI